MFFYFESLVHARFCCKHGQYIRAGMHLQLQKIGRSEKDKQQIIKSFAGHQEYQQIQKLNVVGLDLSTMQNQAVHYIAATV